MNRSTAICILGPTCTGKTDLALRLAKHFPMEIISVDSAMVYRGMDIGTGKPSAEVRSKIPHHLIDICEPEDSYSAGRFCLDAKLAIKQVLERGRLPLLVGGTMLYFKALLQGISELPASSATLREMLQKEALEKGLSFLHRRLDKLDPVAAARIHPNDKQRLLRALEVYEQTRRSLTEHLKQGWNKDSFPYKVLLIALIPTDRTTLHDRIRVRFEEMLKRGFIEEVKVLKRNPMLTLGHSAMKAVGYRQIGMYLDGQIDESKMKREAITATCRLAKRQTTWLNSWPGLLHFKSDDPTWFNQIKEKIRCYQR